MNVVGNLSYNARPDTGSFALVSCLNTPSFTSSVFDGSCITARRFPFRATISGAVDPTFPRLSNIKEAGTSPLYSPNDSDSKSIKADLPFAPPPM